MNGRRWFGAMVLGGLLLAGCGSSAGESDAAGTTSGAASAGTTAGDDAATASGDDTTAAPGAGKGAMASIDACALLTDQEIADAFVSKNPQWASNEFRISERRKVGADSPDGVACEYLWTVVEAAQGTFVAEVVEGDYFALATGGDGAEPVAELPGAKHSQGGSYAKVKGLTVAILGVNTDSVRGTLLKAAAGRV